MGVLGGKVWTAHDTADTTGSPGENNDRTCVLSELTIDSTDVWRDQAACRGIDPEVFYPASEEEAEIAKEICQQCNVVDLCLSYALSQREREGVWGGCTERERRRIVRQRRRSA